MINKKNNNQNQQRYIELQLLMNQLQQLSQQAQVIEGQFIELKKIEENLKDLEKTKPNTNSFSLIGAGIFAESEIKDTKNILMNVGSQVAVKKPIPEAIDITQKQQKEVENILINIENQINNTTRKAQEIELQIQNQQI